MTDDSFMQNILGVTNLIESNDNKILGDSKDGEGVDGEFVDELDLKMTDEELLSLRGEWESKDAAYSPKIKTRQQKNKIYYQGRQKATAGQTDKVVSSNLIFEAQETFIPQALSKNPEPVVYSDNTEEGKLASSDIKTMLQYHADVLCLRKKLSVMVRHWSIYFIGVVKHGWDEKVNDIKTEIRKPINFVLDPDGYIDEYGNYIGAFLGEKIEISAKNLIDLYPEHNDYILIKANAKLGTKLVMTEWWTDEYCFTTFLDKVLDKHKNEFFNYGEQNHINHFAIPKMPYTFLSVFSLQEQPHDITNLVEQNVPNQDRINDRDDQIARNLKASNNSLVLSGTSFNKETAHEAAMAVEDGDPILVPDGNVESAVKRLPATGLPNSIFTAQENDKTNLRTIFGTQGLTALPNENKETTARGMILNNSHDSSRIGGGIGDALEQVADNIFNWWVQLYCVFYDTKHYGAIIGSGRAVEYVSITNSNLERKFVVSVAPNSMKPKDEISEMNLAMERWEQKAIDPIGLMKALNVADPMEEAKKLILWTTDPQMYAQMYLGQPAQGVPPAPGGEGPAQITGTPEQNLSLGNQPANSALNQVKLNQ